MIKKIIRKNRFSSYLLEAYFFSKKNLHAKGWFESRHLHRSIDKKKLPLPWFTYSSIHFLNQKLKVKELNVFEFGSGNSTLWFSDRVKHITSLENDKEYFLTMEEKFKDISNITYKFGELGTNYSSQILEYKNTFDIIIIDGRERINCTKNSLNALKEGGIIIFDNSERESYKEAYNYLDTNNFKKIDFYGMGPIGHQDWQTTIYYKDQNCLNI